MWGGMHPILRGGIQSGVIHFFADVFAQGLETDGGGISQNQLDIYRSLRFGVVGLTLHGPYFGLGFARIDAYFGQTKGLAMTMKKVVATQLILNPPYLVLLFGWMGMLEGKTDLIANTQEKTIAAMIPNFMFWPVANFVNFSFVSPQWRVACKSLLDPACFGCIESASSLVLIVLVLILIADVASCGGMWNTYISLLNKSKDDEKENAKARAAQ
jgi:hypothetical protein